MLQIEYVPRHGTEGPNDLINRPEYPEKSNLTDETVPPKDLPHFDGWSYTRPASKDIESQSMSDTSLETIQSFDDFGDGQTMVEELEAQGRINEKLTSKNAAQRRQIVFLWVLSLTLAAVVAVLWLHTVI